jgi:hypothetical protein
MGVQEFSQNSLNLWSQTLYKTVYDIATAGCGDWYFPLGGVFFIFISYLILDWATEKFPSCFARVMFGFSVFWTIVACLSIYGKYFYLLDIRNHNKFEVVEGTVKQFVPMPVNGHSEESFVVNGKKFAYSDFEVTGGFNNTSSHGGPIHEGLKVRIAYTGDDIIHLEVQN